MATLYFGNNYFTKDIYEHQIKYGYSVIKSIFSEELCKYAIDELWQFLQTRNTGIKRDQPSTWISINWPSSIHGIQQHHRVGYLPIVWDIRVAIREVFSEIWNVDVSNLISSLDGINIARPPELTRCHYSDETFDQVYSKTLKERKDKVTIILNNYCIPDISNIIIEYIYDPFESQIGGFTPNKHFLHTDQSFLTKGLAAIQSVFILDDCTADDSTLLVLESSHKYHEEFYEVFKSDIKNPRENWFKLDDVHVKWYINKGCKFTRVAAPKGSLLLFDSRTIHCNIGSRKGREKSKFRYGVYLCMCPREWASEAILRKRIKAFEEQRMTSHWPQFCKLFPLKSRYSSGTNVSFDNLIDFEITPEIRRLVGYDE